MTVKKYTHEYAIKDMTCLKIYCEHKNITVEKQMNKNLNNFLFDNSKEINNLIEAQKKIVALRKRQD